MQGTDTVNNLILEEESWVRMSHKNLARTGENLPQELSEQALCTLVKCMCSDIKSRRSNFDRILFSNLKISKLELESGISAAESRAVLATEALSQGIKDPVRICVVSRKEEEGKNTAARTHRDQIDRFAAEAKVELIASRIVHEANYLRMRSLSSPPRAVELLSILNNVFLS